MTMDKPSCGWKITFYVFIIVMLILCLHVRGDKKDNETKGKGKSKGQDDTDLSTDPCETNPCLNEGTCNVNNATYNCTCLPQWTGTNCSQAVDFCESTPCENEGVCASADGSYTCDCKKGYNGTDCENEIDFCVSAPCQFNSTCVGFPGGYNCSCVDGTTGTVCETNIDDCAPIPCNEGATCEDRINAYNCICTTGWTGSTCHEDINECTNKTDECSDRANCTNTDGSYNCSCQEGYTGDGKTCTYIDHCAGEGVCINGYCTSQIGGAVCHCRTGWQGSNCSTDINECDLATPCDAQWGLCENTDGSFTCSCKKGSNGDGITCQENTLYDHNMVTPIQGDDEVMGPYVANGGFPFQGQIFNEIYVSINGYVSFGSKFDQPRPKSANIPPGQSLVAPYWYDIENKDSTDSDLFIDIYNLQNSTIINTTMDTIKQDIAEYAGLGAFQPSFVLLATWRDAIPYPSIYYQDKEAATFQVLVTTNSTHSYVIYNYDQGHMKWNPQSENRTILIGQTGPDGTTTNVLAEDQDIYRPDKYSNVKNSQGNPRPGRFYFSLGSNVENNNLDCVKWNLEQTDEDIAMHSSLVEPCPCTSKQANADMRFESMGVQADTECWQSRFSKEDTFQVCCYSKDDGALIAGPPGGHLKLLDDTRSFTSCCKETNLCHLFYNKRPSNDCSKYQPPQLGLAWGDPHFRTVDKTAYTFNGRGQFVIFKLLDDSFSIQGRLDQQKDSDDKLTKATVLVAIVAKSKDSDSVAVYKSSTPDLNGQIKSNVTDQLNTTFPPQGQTFKYTGVHISRISRESVIVYFSNGIGLQIWSSNNMLRMVVAVPRTDKFKGEGLTGGLLGTYTGSSADDFLLRNGTTLDINPMTDFNNTYDFGKSWEATINESLFNYEENNKKHSDFVYPDFIPENYMEKLDNISLNFPNINETIMNEMCGNVYPCKFDYAVTGSAEVANATKNEYEEYSKSIIDLDNFPPKWNISLPKMLDVEAGSTFTLNLQAIGSNITYTIVTDATNYTFENDVFTWLPNIMYRNESISMPDIKFYAKNLDGATSLYWPTVRYCACAGGSQCSWEYMNKMEYTFSSSRSYRGECKCSPIQSGRYCQETRNPCASNSCFPGVTCSPKVESDMGYQCASCPNGYKGTDGVKCYAENECLDEVAGCTQGCTNWLQGYTCLCSTGYNLQADGKKCTDIDECTLGEPHHNCTGPGQYCVNTPGTFDCQCKAGFYFDHGASVCKEAKRFGGKIKFGAVKTTSGIIEWSEDLKNTKSEKYITVKNELETMINKPYKLDYKEKFIKSDVYSLKQGSIESEFNLLFDTTASVTESNINSTLHKYLLDNNCLSNAADCTVGNILRVNADASQAFEKDLCASTKDNDCDSASTTCTSKGGSFTCDCKNGYKAFLNYNSICQDVDECGDTSHVCDSANSICTNVPGAYSCKCNHGYKPKDNSSKVCIDVCTGSPCYNDGLCKRLESSYRCVCGKRYMGEMCEDDNPDVSKYRIIAIAVGATLGIICFILLIVVICICLRNKQRKQSYSCGPLESGGDKYGGAVALHGFGPEKSSGATPRRPTEYEMKENGSQENLLNQQHGARRENVNAAHSRSQGLENPAYSANAHETTPKTAGQYF